jgi:hypothetical protein
MPFDGASLFPDMQIPEFDIVPTATDKSLSIRADGKGINPV